MPGIRCNLQLFQKGQTRIMHAKGCGMDRAQ